MAPVARGARLPLAIVTTPMPVTYLLRALARVHVRTETESCVFGALGRYGALDLTCPTIIQTRKL